jgi:hypothetical protein
LTWAFPETTLPPMSRTIAGVGSVWPLAIAPSLVVAAIGLLKLSNELVSIGPLDRAQFGWSIPIPMLLLAPAVGGLVARWTGERPAALALIATALGLGVFVQASLASTVDRIGCAPHSEPAAVFAYVVPIAVVSTIGYALAGLVALWNRSRLVVAVVLGVGAATLAGTAVLLTFAALFPGVTCTPR